MRELKQQRREQMKNGRLKSADGTDEIRKSIKNERTNVMTEQLRNDRNIAKQDGRNGTS
jgi:hypothetical protein